MNISIIGAGGFGTTMAIMLSKKGYSIKLWANFPELEKKIIENKENIDFLPGFKIPDSVFISSNMELILKNNEIIIIAIPSLYFKNIIEKIKEYKSLIKNSIFISLTKGIHKDGLLMSDIFFKVIGKKGFINRYLVLSGPNLAREIASEIPSSAVIAGYNEAITKRIQKIINTNYFRVYTQQDVVGVQIGGAFKNVIAIAAGICDGLGFGVNTKSSLLSRGLAEMARIGVEMGALPHTFFGLSGMGDLIATSFSPLSRNRNFGEKIGKGVEPDEILKNTKMVIEGVENTKFFYNLGFKMDIDTPITEVVYKIIYKSLSPEEGFKLLMDRKLKFEFY